MQSGKRFMRLFYNLILLYQRQMNFFDLRLTKNQVSVLSALQAETNWFFKKNDNKKWLYLKTFFLLNCNLDLI